MYLPAHCIGRWVATPVAGHSPRFEALERLLSMDADWVVDAFNLIIAWLHEIISRPYEWSMIAFYAAIRFVHAHLFFAHIVAWSIFFGPIILLVPFLLVHELIIITIYNLGYILHGLLPGSLPDQYERLRDSLLDTRESMYSFIDRSSFVFNKWTSEHMPLMVSRMVGGVVGTALLYAIWVGW